jgi:hypothetical protein
VASAAFVARRPHPDSNMESRCVFRPSG